MDTFILRASYCSYDFLSLNLLRVKGRQETRLARLDEVQCPIQKDQTRPPRSKFPPERPYSRGYKVYVIWQVQRSDLLSEPRDQRSQHGLKLSAIWIATPMHTATDPKLPHYGSSKAIQGRPVIQEIRVSDGENRI